LSDTTDVGREDFSLLGYILRNFWQIFGVMHGLEVCERPLSVVNEDILVVNLIFLGLGVSVSVKSPKIDRVDKSILQALTPDEFGIARPYS